METEIYFHQELSDVTFEVEALDEWKAIAGKLKMDKQLSLTKGKDSPIPYPWMNETMVRVFNQLCPRSVEYTEYDKTPIPLEVMKQIAFTVKDKHFSKIEIWYDDKTPCPVVVGFNGDWYAYDRKYNHIKDDKGEELHFSNEKKAAAFCKGKELTSSFDELGKYLIARWGAEKKPFNDLKADAITRFVDQHGAKMKSEIQVLSQKLECIQENAVLYFADEMSHSRATTSQDF